MPFPACEQGSIRLPRGGQDSRGSRGRAARLWGPLRGCSAPGAEAHGDGWGQGPQTQRCPRGDAGDTGPGGTLATRTSSLGNMHGCELGLGAAHSTIRWRSGTTLLSSRAWGWCTWGRCGPLGGDWCSTRPVSIFAIFSCIFFFSKTVNTPGLRFTLQGEKVGQGSWIQNNVVLKGVQVSPLTVAGAPRVRGENPTKQAGAGTAGPRVPSPSALSRGLPHRPEPPLPFPQACPGAWDSLRHRKGSWFGCNALASSDLSPLR